MLSRSAWVFLILMEVQGQYRPNSSYGLTKGNSAETDCFLVRQRKLATRPPNTFYVAL